MKLLKNLTKVVSVALAAVAVFSAGLSASALGRGQGILKRGGMEYIVMPGKDKEGRLSFALKRDAKASSFSYAVARFGPRGTYSCVFHEPTGELSAWYSIDTPITGDLSRATYFQIVATGDMSPATSLRYRVQRSSKDPRKWLVEGVNADLGRNYIVEFRDVEGRSTDANQVAYIYEGRTSKDKRPIAIFYSKDCSLNVRYIIAFLSAVGIPHK